MEQKQLGTALNLSRPQAIEQKEGDIDFRWMLSVEALADIKVIEENSRMALHNLRRMGLILK